MIAELLMAIPDWLFDTIRYADECAAVAGGVLIGAGFAGRRTGWGPRCAACSFDLRAVPDGTACCPECGASLARAKAVRFGGRARRWGMMSAGAALVLLAGFSTVAGFPHHAVAWRQRVIASAFSYERLMDLAVAGDPTATAELAAEARGVGRPRRTTGVYRPGQECLDAVLTRLEADPASHATLLPIIITPNSFLWVSESAASIRIARVLCDVAADNPRLLDALPAGALNDIFRSPNPAAIAYLLTSPTLVERLFSRVAPVQRVSEKPIHLTVRPSFGGSGHGIWTHNTPFAVHAHSAQWRVAGAADSPWNPVRSIDARPFNAELGLTITDAPPRGAIEVRVEGELRRREPGSTMRTPAGGAPSQTPDVPPPDTSPDIAAPAAGNPTFTWSQIVNLTPRNELTLTPVPPGNAQATLAAAFGRMMLLASADTTAQAYTLMSDLSTSIEGRAICLRGTLMQEGASWAGAPIPTGTSWGGGTVQMGGNESNLTFIAPGFDPRKPFAVVLETDLERLRARATGDTDYVNLRVQLNYNAVDQKPSSVTAPATSVQD